ncbi:MAG TPA: ATP-binding protein [Aggregatilineales bacterium]|nr:ATP-binding protein [Aggregatilineales bacterium]
MNSSRTEHFDATLNNLATMRRFVKSCIENFEIQTDAELIYDMVFATNEIATNIIEHGYKNQPGVISIEVTQSDGAVMVHLRDDAPTFDPRQAAKPDLDLPLEHRPPGKVGVFMTLESMDRVDHRARGDRGNELTLIKYVKT